MRKKKQAWFAVYELPSQTIEYMFSNKPEYHNNGWDVDSGFRGWKYPRKTKHKRVPMELINCIYGKLDILLLHWYERDKNWNRVELPSGTIEKIIGRKLTADDDPVLWEPYS